MNKFLSLLSFCSLLSAPAYAGGGQDTSDGCGLGWQVTNKKSGFGTTTRGTTNAFVPPTFGMTSGTIGCEKHTIAKNEVEGAVFAYANFDSIRNDMAEGEGEYLNGLAQSMGCDAIALPAFGKMTQEHFQEILNTESGLDLFDSFKSQIKSDHFLASHCNA